MQARRASACSERCPHFSIRTQRIAIPDHLTMSIYPVAHCALGRQVVCAGAEGDLPVCYGPDGGLVDQSACTMARHLNSCVAAMWRGASESAALAHSPEALAVPLEQPRSPLFPPKPDSGFEPSSRSAEARSWRPSPVTPPTPPSL